MTATPSSAVPTNESTLGKKFDSDYWSIDDNTNGETWGSGSSDDEAAASLRGRGVELLTGSEIEKLRDRRASPNGRNRSRRRAARDQGDGSSSSRKRPFTHAESLCGYLLFGMLVGLLTA